MVRGYQPREPIGKLLPVPKVHQYVRPFVLSRKFHTRRTRPVLKHHNNPTDLAYLKTEAERMLLNAN